jgi:hypothetical protein
LPTVGSADLNLVAKRSITHGHMDIGRFDPALPATISRRNRGRLSLTGVERCRHHQLGALDDQLVLLPKLLRRLVTTWPLVPVSPIWMATSRFWPAAMTGLVISKAHVTGLDNITQVDG